jgi:hypothetical protein
MEPIIQGLTQNVADDVRELVLAVAPKELPALQEKTPPNMHWQVPLGFVSLAAVGALLVAAGGLQTRVQEQRHGARRQKTHLHKRKLHAFHAPIAQ